MNPPWACPPPWSCAPCPCPASLMRLPRSPGLLLLRPLGLEIGRPLVPRPDVLDRVLIRRPVLVDGRVLVGAVLHHFPDVRAVEPLPERLLRVHPQHAAHLRVADAAELGAGDLEVEVV